MDNRSENKTTSMTGGGIFGTLQSTKAIRAYFSASRDLPGSSVFLRSSLPSSMNSCCFSYLWDASYIRSSSSRTISVITKSLRPLL